MTFIFKRNVANISFWGANATKNLVLINVTHWIELPDQPKETE